MLLRFFVFGLALTSSAASDPVLSFPGNSTYSDRQLSMTRFQKILKADVGHLAEHWSDVMEFEWSRARALQETTSPFIVCDVQYGQTGEDSEVVIQELLAFESITPLYNKADMTCFTVQALASELDLLPNGYQAAPLTAEMKLGDELLDVVATTNVSTVEAVFCDASTNPEQVFEEIKVADRRRLQLDSFVQSRPFDHDWHRRLKSKKNKDSKENSLSEDSILEDSVVTNDTNSTTEAANETIDCQAVIDSMIVSSGRDTIELTLAVEYVGNEDYKNCLYEVVIALALQPESCFLWAYPETELFNTIASSIVQGGEENLFYSVGLDGTGQVVSLSDTGIDTDNCYFRDSRRDVQKQRSNWFDLSIRKVVQYFPGSDAVDQARGHGTHVASTIAGRKSTDGRNEVDGEADGVARAAKLAFYDIGDASGRLITPLPDRLFGPAYAAGARIHSASWGVPLQNFYTGYDRAMDTFMYENPDFLFVAAAGNDGATHPRNSVCSPSLCKNGISVGASQNGEPHINNNQQGPDYLADFSSRGPTRDGRRKPDVTAPGNRLLSANAEPGRNGECGAIFKSGTSMAAPVVSGSAAIVRQYFLAGWHVTGRPDSQFRLDPRASLVKAVLLNGAQSLVAVQNGSGQITASIRSYDVNQGFGRIDLSESLPIAGKNSLSGVFVNGKTIGNRQEDVVRVTIRNADRCSSFSATLVWTDPAGAPNCNECVLNDLDLFVMRGSRTFYPNGRSQSDTVNNAERVQIPNFSNGETLSIHVKGTNLLRNQEYSLAIVGCFATGGDDGSDETPPSPTPPSPVPPVPSPPIEEEECEDGSGSFKIGNGNSRACGWLSSNTGNFGYLCLFRDVASVCPITCDACLLTESSSGQSTMKRAQTALDGRIRWHGNFFDIQAKKNLTVRHFDVHLSTTDNLRVLVFYRNGSLSRTRRNTGWIKMCDATVKSNGVGSVTRIPESACTPRFVSKDSMMSFYVTLIGQPNLVMTKVEQGTASPIDNVDMRYRSGIAVTYRNAGSFFFHNFNGAIQYTVEGSCADGGGTVEIDLSVGDRTCAWLGQNMGRFEFACNYTRVATHCPKTCQVC